MKNLNLLPAATAARPAGRQRTVPPPPAELGDAHRRDDRQRLETFARLAVTDPAEPDRPYRVELAAHWRSLPPVIMDIGSVLHVDDVVAGTMSAPTRENRYKTGYVLVTRVAEFSCPTDGASAAMDRRGNGALATESRPDGAA